MLISAPTPLLNSNLNHSFYLHVTTTFYQVSEFLAVSLWHQPIRLKDPFFESSIVSKL